MHRTHTIEQAGKENRGFTLLLSVLVAGIVLAIGISILNITLKEFILSGIARESAKAFYAADAGMECARYWDVSSQGDKFDVPRSGNASVTCMGGSATSGSASSGSIQEFSFEWGSPRVCAIVQVTKYYSTSAPVNMGGSRNCPTGVECTRIESRGYNKACGEITGANTVERALRVLY